MKLGAMLAYPGKHLEAHQQPQCRARKHTSHKRRQNLAGVVVHRHVHGPAARMGMRQGGRRPLPARTKGERHTKQESRLYLQPWAAGSMGLSRASLGIIRVTLFKPVPGAGLLEAAQGGGAAARRPNGRNNW